MNKWTKILDLCRGMEAYVSYGFTKGTGELLYFNYSNEYNLLMKREIIALYLNKASINSEAIQGKSSSFVTA